MYLAMRRIGKFYISRGAKGPKLKIRLSYLTTSHIWYQCVAKTLLVTFLCGVLSILGGGKKLWLLPWQQKRKLWIFQTYIFYYITSPILYQSLSNWYPMTLLVGWIKWNKINLKKLNLVTMATMFSFKID